MASTCCSKADDRYELKNYPQTIYLYSSSLFGLLFVFHSLYTLLLGGFHNDGYGHLCAAAGDSWGSV